MKTISNLLFAVFASLVFVMLGYSIDAFGQCPLFVATSAEHAQAGRAYSTGLLYKTYYATGSNERLSRYGSVALYETSAGYFSLSNERCQDVQCQSVTASNEAHVLAQRAVETGVVCTAWSWGRCWSWDRTYAAIGSQEVLPNGKTSVSTLYSSDGNIWSLRQCTGTNECENKPPALASHRLSTMVIDAGSVNTINFTAKIAGPATQARLCLSPSINSPCEEVVALTRGDNCTYSANLSVGQIAAYFNAATDVNRTNFGFLTADSVNGRVNLGANLYTSNIALCSATRVNDTVQYCDSVVNLVMPEIFGDDNGLTAAKRIAVARRFYSYFRDDYDFLNIVSGSANFIQNRSFLSAKNNVQGIGRDVFDNAADYGSGGRLQGTVIYPISNLFDGAATSHSHEIAHNWANYLSLPALATGRPHWPISDLANDILGYSDAGGQGLRFTKKLTVVDGQVQAMPDSTPKAFSDLTLYLMGLAPIDEVGDHFVMHNQSDPNDFPSANFTMIRASEIPAHEGPRIPAYPDTPRNFRVATIVVSDAPLDVRSMSFYNYFAQRMASSEDTVQVKEGLAPPELQRPFYSATGRRGTLDSSIQR